ncbi:RagB/SusD family nutrient uptake outer membrane protein, partial [Bacteroides cellulosilyticus]
ASRGGLIGSSQSRKGFRNCEVLLNRAEAAYELGLETGDDKLKAEALTYVNEVRARAGATLHQMVNNPEDLGMEKFGFPVDENLQYIRDVRARELCFEYLRIYDLR